MKTHCFLGGFFCKMASFREYPTGSFTILDFQEVGEFFVVCKRLSTEFAALKL